MNGRHNYTVTELATVIVIAGMLTAFAIARFRKMPAFISLDSKINEFRKILAQARSFAACRGSEINVSFDAGKRRIFISGKSPEEEAEKDK